MEDIIIVSIGLGLLISLFFSEILGIAAGGMVVPGYIAIYLNKPFTIIFTLIVSYLTYFIVNALSSVMIIYGRRRTVLTILIGFLVGWFFRIIGAMEILGDSVDLNVVGYIIPGLIAIWMSRQGVVITMTSLITSSVIVRLFLILIFGKELIQ